MVYVQKHLGEILTSYKDLAYLEITTSEGIFRNFINAKLISDVYKYINGDWHDFDNEIFSKSILME